MFQVVKDAKKSKSYRTQIALFRGFWFDFFLECKTKNNCSFEKHSLMKGVSPHIPIMAYPC